MRYTQRNDMIGEKDINFLSDQQNRTTSNQGNIFINFISRALYHIYIYPISDWIFLSTETDEVYYGHHESSEKQENDPNTERNKVLPSNYQCIDMVYIIKLDPAMYSFSMFAKICIILGGRW